MTTKNLWDSAKAVLREKFITMQFNIKKQEKHQINNLTLYLKQLEKEEQRKSKVSRRKEIIKIRADINEVEMRKMIAKINKMKSWFFEKINKIDKPLARLIKKKGDKIKSTKLEMKKERLQQNAEIPRILRDCYEQQWAEEPGGLQSMGSRRVGHD